MKTTKFTSRLERNWPVQFSIFLHEVAFLGAAQPEQFLYLQSPPRRPLSESQIQRVAALPGFPAVSSGGMVKPEPAWLYMQTAPTLIVAAVNGTLPTSGSDPKKRQPVSKQWRDAVSEPSDLIPVTLGEFIEQFFRPGRRVSRVEADRIGAMPNCPSFACASLGLVIPLRKGVQWAAANASAIRAILKQTAT